MKKSFIPTNEYVKVLGRTIMLDDCRLLCTSGSGVEFAYTGAFLKITFLGDSSTDRDDNIVRWRDVSRVLVTVDGRTMLDTTVTTKKESYIVYGEDPSTPMEKHVVRIIKLSEPRMSSVGLGEIEILSDGNPVPTADKEKYVEFIGDSITCGYGVDTEHELCPFSTSSENASRAYAYLAAHELDLDYSLVSYSGHGLVSGWTPDPEVPKTEELLPPYYGIVSYSYNNFRGIEPQTYKWEDERKPDIIVINLGTNDWSYTQGDAVKTAEYERLYLEFLKTVRACNPNAHIICSLGVMGDDLFPSVERVVKTFSMDNNDNAISVLHFTPHDPEKDGLVADYHPSPVSQIRAAKEMAEELKKWI